MIDSRLNLRNPLLNYLPKPYQC